MLMWHGDVNAGLVGRSQCWCGRDISMLVRQGDVKKSWRGKEISTGVGQKMPMLELHGDMPTSMRRRDTSAGAEEKCQGLLWLSDASSGVSEEG